MNIKDEGGVAVKYDGNAVNKIENIKVTNISKKYLSEEVCVINDVTYDIWDKAGVYVDPGIGSDYEEATIEDILDGNYSTIRVFYDNTPDRGGKIRMILAR